MKLYYAPGACSIGIHVLLNEIGKPFEAEKVDLAGGKQYQPEFTNVNPKSKVPTLVRDDGSVLTEFPAIATWLARTNPDKKLLADDAEGMARTFEMLDYVVASVHMQGFSRLFRPANYAPSESDHDAVKARGREMASKAFAIIDEKLKGKDYVTGTFSIADCALFYVELWATRMKIAMPANVAAHFERMKARPAVQKTLADEGLAA
ncbi:glutathione S-transferase [Vineibacter terrae]|uniref:Glutathione S-transferase n=1 Tax=Vineibacter terrae TaxID=2586908 RepID=A0A5C8PJE7_9HYPH|nr:glutathione binding-like protein [Vineibacter terrae]TXL73485.1 glutathione S-transferase [Vineibacter terrae]